MKYVGISFMMPLKIAEGSSKLIAHFQLSTLNIFDEKLKFVLMSPISNYQFRCHGNSNRAKVCEIPFVFLGKCFHSCAYAC